MREREKGLCRQVDFLFLRFGCTVFGPWQIGLGRKGGDGGYGASLVMVVWGVLTALLYGWRGQVYFLATVATVTPLLPNDKHTRTAVGITQASAGMKA